MASVKSLGLHEPACLPTLVSEGILPVNPSPTQYKWRSFPSCRPGYQVLEDDLVITQKCVTWSRNGLIERIYRFDIENENVVDALFTQIGSLPSSSPTFQSSLLTTHNPAKSDKGESAAAGEQLKVRKTRIANQSGFKSASNQSSDSGKPVRSELQRNRALVVLLQTQARIFVSSQTSHIVHIPFEVDAIFPSYNGILLQRKLPSSDRTILSPSLPSAPHNTFALSQASASGNLDEVQSPDSRLFDRLEKLSTTGNEDQASHLPRTFSLSDPMDQLGAVTVDGPQPAQLRVNSKLLNPASPWLDDFEPSDQLLYISPEDEVPNFNKFRKDKIPLAIGVSVNTAKDSVGLWSISFPNKDKGRKGVQKSAGSGSFRRRSSFASRMSTGANTPLGRSFHQVGKEPVKDDAVASNQTETLHSVLEHAEGGRKSSRRVSSLLARTDLSTDHDRAAFSDLAGVVQSSRKLRRGTSTGTSRTSTMADYGSPSFDTHLATSLEVQDFPTSARHISPSIDTAMRANNRLNREEEGDEGRPQRPGPHRPHDVAFKSVHVETKSTNVSRALQVADCDVHCFTIEFPPEYHDQSETASFLVCVMFRQRAELLILKVKALPRSRRTNDASDGSLPNAANFSMEVKATWHSGVLDACKIAEGSHQWLLILDTKGSTLTLQAPWSSFLRLDLPSSVNVHDLNDVSTRYSPNRAREGGPKRLLPQGLKNIRSLGRSSPYGRFDLIDSNDTAHRFEIQMKPATPFIHRLIRVCHIALPSSESSADSMLRGWWDAMRWIRGRDAVAHDLEWTAFVVLIFSLATHLTPTPKANATPRQRKKKGAILRSSSGAQVDTESWDEMIRQEGVTSMGQPEWASEQSPWAWTITSEPNKDYSSASDIRRPSTTANSPPFQKRLTHITHWAALSKEFANSNVGRSALGTNGYLPTASSRDSSTRLNNFATMLFALHLYREEMKLDITSCHHAQALTPILAQLGTWLSWERWSFRSTSFYMSEDVAVEHLEFEDTVMAAAERRPEPMAPPSIFSHLEQIACGDSVNKYPSLAEACTICSSASERRLQIPAGVLEEITPRTYLLLNYCSHLLPTTQNISAELLRSAGVTSEVLESFPESIAAFFRAVMKKWQARPSSDWSSKVLAWVGREDVSLLGHSSESVPHSKWLDEHNASSIHDTHHACSQAMEVDRISPYDGSAEVDRQSITRILFGQDQRFAEAASLLHPLQAPAASCVAEPGWSESDLLEAQQEVAKIVALRTLSVSLGRGLLFFRARLPKLTEKYPVHGFTLSTTIRPSGTTVTVDRTVYSEDKVSWAFFHAGVESGLSISNNAHGIDASWILFNKPKELNNRHAGFLLALGLNGHLRSMAKWVAFKYLTPKHNVTSIALLLGLSASYIGTMDSLITRLLSVHISRMLPPGAAELNLAPLTQTCGIFGMGLIYCGTQHRRMSEIMLSELESTGAEDLASPMDTLRDEGYCLAAGFALGFINLGKGKDLKGLRDMHVTERLLTLAVAIKTVDHVHISDNCTAGAVMAIALLYMKSNDQALANKIDVPDTRHQYEYVRPDLFLLRTVTKQLILWDGVRASIEWISQQLPSSFVLGLLSKISCLCTEDLPYLNILSGLCFSIGLRYAGSGNVEARNALCSILDQFLRLCRLPAPNYDAKIARITVRNCQDLLALSAACVMAGTGDIILLRRLRSLHGRTDSETPYGSHLAAHFAIGILFLGGGTYTFSTSDKAIASLLCAFYPLFPSTVLDNKSHLQALRHFWVLAAEPRCLIPRNLETRRPVSVPIRIIGHDGNVTDTKAPCLLPDFSSISRVHVLDHNYWPVNLDFSPDSKDLTSFKAHQSIFLRHRTAYDATNTSVFAATTKTLQERLLTHSLYRQPFEWILDLSALSGLDRAERSLVLPKGPGTMIGSLSTAIRGTAVDDRLMLENTCLDSLRSERLYNLRLFLRWAAECEKRGDDIGWLRADTVENLRAQLALMRKQHALTH